MHRFNLDNFRMCPKGFSALSKRAKFSGNRQNTRYNLDLGEFLSFF